MFGLEEFGDQVGGRIEGQCLSCVGIRVLLLHEYCRLQKHQIASTVRYEGVHSKTLPQLVY